MSQSDSFLDEPDKSNLRVLEYLTFLSKTQLFGDSPVDWREIYDTHDQLNFVERLVLIHPRWYDPNGNFNKGKCPVRGDRSRPVTRPYGRCESMRYWQYPCPFDNAKIRIDHVFPWSLGGPSVPENTAYLCEYHNLLKGPDIHQLQFDETEFLWFPNTLERVTEELT